MDVDGTLTDGKIYMGVDGECFKAFDIKDGYALHTLLKEKGIIPVIITARKSPMVEHRCKELGVTEIHQGVMNKLGCLDDIIKSYSSLDKTTYDFSNVAYIGDDLLDLQCMKPIKNAGGIIGCPSNAVREVISVSDFMSHFKGGEGAVRDFVEFIITRQGNEREKNIKKRLEKAIEFISKLDFPNLKKGKYEVSSDFYYTVNEYFAFDENEVQYESHRQYIDIQWVYEGREVLYITNIINLKESDEYNNILDVVHYYPSSNMSSIVLSEGGCAILFPQDAHKPGRFQCERSIVKKVVGKLKIQI